VHCRLKFEYDSSDSDRSSPSTFEVTSQPEFLDGDPEIPLISRSEAVYPVNSLIQSLLSSDIDKRRMCKVQLLGVMWNGVFMI